MDTTTFHYRKSTARLRVIHDAFAGKAAELLPHLTPEAAQQAEIWWGPRPAFLDYNERGEIANLITRLERRIKRLQDAAKRGPLTTDLDVKIDGEVAPQFARVLAAFRKIPGINDPGNRITVGKTHVVLSWSSGAYTIHRGAVTGNNPDFASYAGPIEFEEILLRRGGPFQFEITTDRLRAIDLSQKVSTWRICLALMREKGARRGGFIHEDILHRFRGGNAVTFKTEQRHGRTCTKVTIAAGKADPAWVKQVATAIQTAAARAERLKRFKAQLEDLGTIAANQFCANEERAMENLRRELAAAGAEFTLAAAALHAAMQNAVYKKDLPAAPYAAMPKAFPARKAVTNGVLHVYNRAERSFTQAWERLTAARQALPESEWPADQRLEAVAQKLAATEMPVGQVTFALE
ncbi:MAG: hypothetical protein PHE83_17430 [Opitutaceae bacterium]|nr:hypothetical protein [Opitutaceae bacterium]